jgi:putative SOS response-associated peptidase YedK
MRRFVQALSSGSGLPPSLPDGVRSALVQLPDRYNISLRQPAGAMLAIDGLWHVGELLWGLIPSWEREPATRYSTQAARLERAPRSRMYRRAWAARRCLVPMTGYYKWDRGDAASERSRRQPYFVQAADGSVLFAAGLWECWTGTHADRDGATAAADREDDVPPVDPVYSFTVLTHPNAAIPAPLTPDGPVFIPAHALDEWVSVDPRAAMRLALRAPTPKLEAYAVSRRVADRRVDHYSLLEPADPQEVAPEHVDPDEVDDG